ncbi:MAG: hypothetical protein GQ527_11090 [Bacteroidales bacterium]|nr:hypothetical protein [Bacteroidales bacterium]
MINISFVITEEIEDVNRFISSISNMNLDDFQLQLILVSQKKLAKDDLLKIVGLKHVEVLELLYPEDEELLLSEVLQEMKGDYFLIYSLEIIYPAHFLENLFLKKPKEVDISSQNRAPYMQRVLKAVQQSKYGMGILLKDIKREYPEFKTSVAFEKQDFKNLKMLQLTVGDGLAKELLNLVEKSELEKKAFTPYYSEICYYTDVRNFMSAVHKEAPLLSFRKNPNAIGFPFYMMIFILISLLMSPFLIKAIFPLLLITAFYLLAITLESLAITTIKKQGDIFPGLMIFFPFLHIYYLLAYFSKLFSSK